MTELVSTHTKILAKFLSETSFENLPVSLIERAKLTIADTVGIAIKGSGEPEMQRFYKGLPEGDKAFLIKEGFTGTDDIAMAGFANATAICFVELDELSHPATHGTLHVLPAALAFSQYLDKTGSDFLTAYILGYEVHNRLHKSFQFRKGIYPHGNSGHVGAIVAVGKLLDWGAEQLRQAINCMASLPLGTSFKACFTESTVASTFASFATPMALIVKNMVESGFTGYDSALGDTFGHILGEGFNPIPMTKGLGEEYGLMNNFFKFHATCGVIHPVLEAASDALNFKLQHDEYPPLQPGMVLKEGEIRKIRILSGDDRILKLDFSPGHKQSVKFSLPFSLAAYVIMGEANPETISESMLDNQQVRSLEKRISLELDPDFQDKNTEPLLARVIIEFYDGSMLSGECKGIYGRTGRPVKHADIYNKFRYLTDGILNNNNKDRIWNSVNSLEKLQNMRDLFSS